MAEPQGDFKCKEKHWLQDTMLNTKKRLDMAQARYKKHYYKRLRKHTEIFKEDDDLFLRVEQKNENDHRHKLAPFAEGLFKLKKAECKTVVIERPDHFAESVSRVRVAPDPKPKKFTEVNEILKPLSTTQTYFVYPENKEMNKTDLTKPLKPKD